MMHNVNALNYAHRGTMVIGSALFSKTPEVAVLCRDWNSKLVAPMRDRGRTSVFREQVDCV